MNILCILDGFGISENEKDNAIKLARKPNIDKIFNEYGYVLGNASGTFVGLPKGQMGNSEVGHLNIGSGRIVYQDLTKITKDIEDGTFFDNEVLKKSVEHCKNNNSSLHIMGLLSDGGVHSHITHLYALMQLAKDNNIKNVYIHCFMDGRDTEPNSGIKFIKELEQKIEEIGVGEIATVAGRYYAMDRDKNYDRVKKAYDVLTKSDLNSNSIKDAESVIKESYKEEVFDEFILPAITTENKEVSRIKDNDSIIFFNFRPDRARELTRCFVDDEFDFFSRKKLENINFVCFTDYDESIKNKYVAFKKEDIKNTLGEVVSKKGLRQIRIAETEKYAHVTFFLNGGKEKPFDNEERVLVPSPKEVPTYDLKPEMSAYEVCEEVLNAIDSEKYDLIIVNFANPDMVGHTGILNAAIKAIEAVDKCIGLIYDKIEGTDTNMFLCADHGNAEKMSDEEGNPFTAHTSNQVPFSLVSNKHYKLKEGGSLCDIAPTLLELMNIEKPKEMTGKSLIKGE